MSEPVWRAYRCPECDAGPGEHCEEDGKRVHTHKARLEGSDIAGTVSRAMRNRSALESLWFNVVNNRQQESTK